MARHRLRPGGFSDRGGGAGGFGMEEAEMITFENEEVLPDDYPVYGGYLYVVDGKPYQSDWHGITVKQLKQYLMAAEIRRCNIFARRNA
jgi:hypothetical protein